MAIGRITGPMLFSNLERQGQDLAIDGNLVYADVLNRRVGINLSTPQYSFDSPGNVRLANLTILANTITSNTGQWTSTSLFKITDTTDANADHTGALQVYGGGSISANLWVGGNLEVGGNTHITGNLTVSGTQVIIGSTNLSVLDPIIDLHTYANLAPLTSNDGYDIGLKFHYYDYQDSAAFLGRANDSGDLEWYARGSDVGNVFVGTAYGNIKTGSMLLVNSTPSTSTTTGALVIKGGLGVVGNINANALSVSTITSTVINATTGNITTVVSTDTTTGTLYATNLSTGNVAITGGYATGLANVYATTSAITNFSTGNAVITGGYINAVTNVYATTSAITNFSTGNAVITGGYINNLANISATYITGTNLNTGNAVITGGYINNLANVTATNATLNNISSGNIYATGTTFGTWSTANVGYYSNITNVTTNSTFYPVLVDKSTGNAALETANTITFNPNSGNLTVGNVIGNVYATSITTSANIIANNFVGNLFADTITGIHGNITLTPNSNSSVIVNTTSAILLPIGSTSERPSGVPGYVRYNSDTLQVEYYSNGTWIPLTSSVTDQTITGDNTSTVFLLDHVTTNVGILVSINGTLQQPGVAYTVSGSQITFAEAPLSSDIIDVRFLSATLDINQNEITAANITVGTANTIVDTFWANTIRSAKYTISSTSPYDATMAEIMIIQHNNTVVINTYGVLNTGSNTLTYSANTAGGIVNLLANGTTSGNQLKVQKTYFYV